MLPAIQLNHITKRYALRKHILDFQGPLGINSKTKRFKLALDGISLSITHSERVGMVGANGSGKTTLLRIISGLTQPTTGKIKINGTVHALMNTGYGFNDELSGLENIRNTLIYNGISDDAFSETIADIVNFAELGDFIHHPIKTYSLGMRTRLEFATATAINPNILLIDEVLGAGDGYFARKCIERMRKKIDGTTLLMVSHDLDQIREFCDRVIWLHEGHLREDGPTEKVLEHYREYMKELLSKYESEKSDHNHDVSTEQVTIHTDKTILERLRCLIRNDVIDDSVIIKFEYGDQLLHKKVIYTGDPLELRVTIFLTRPLRPVVFGISKEGSLVFELYGELLPVGNHCLRMYQDRSVIGCGYYILVAALSDPNKNEEVVTLGSDLLYLQIASTNWSEPPLVHMDGEWSSGKNRKPLKSKVSAWV